MRLSARTKTMGPQDTKARSPMGSGPASKSSRPFTHAPSLLSIVFGMRVATRGALCFTSALGTHVIMS